jgi:hypothetical protein
MSFMGPLGGDRLQKGRFEQPRKLAKQENNPNQARTQTGNSMGAEKRRRPGLHLIGVPGLSARLLGPFS